MRIRQKLPIILAAVMILTAAFILTGCETETKTLEDYVSESPSIQEQIEDSLSGLNNSDMDVTVSYDENRIIITGTMKTTYKKNVLKTMKKSYAKYMKKHLPETMDNAVAGIENDTHIDGVTIQVIINNGDGKEIWSETYPLEPEEEATTSESSEDDGGDDADKSDKDGGDKEKGDGEKDKSD